jgi:hypothetical protein
MKCIADIIGITLNASYTGSTFFTSAREVTDISQQEGHEHPEVGIDSLIVAVLLLKRYSKFDSPT